MCTEKFCNRPAPGEHPVSGGARIVGPETNGTWRLKTGPELRTGTDTYARPCKFSIAFIASCTATFGLWKGFMTDGSLGVEVIEQRKRLQRNRYDPAIHRTTRALGVQLSPRRFRAGRVGRRVSGAAHARERFAGSRWCVWRSAISPV